MSLETAVVVGTRGQALYWHFPPGRSAVYLPDTRDLWDVLWTNREILAGIAHSHPGAGLPGPSYEDLTTFAGLDEGLGKRFTWWITSRDRLIELRWEGPGRLDYASREVEVHQRPGSSVVEPEPRWLHNLRDVSYNNEEAR